MQTLLQKGSLASISHPTKEPHTIGLLFQHMHLQYGDLQQFLSNVNKCNSI